MSVTAVVVAAGEGLRLGSGPKAFVELGGEALLVHAARAVLNAREVDAATVVVGEPDVARAESVLADAGLDAAGVVGGGPTRAASVLRGLEACPRGTRTVAVHDAARPLASPALVERTLAALVEPWAAVAPGLPVVDTLKLVDETQGRVVRTVDRRGLWGVQTPQVFGLTTLMRAHHRIGGEPTDDLSLVEEAGGRVRLVEGERANFKITYPEDLELAEKLI